MINVLSRAAEAKFDLDPFPHMLIDDALDADVYASLASQFPPLEVVNRRRGRAKSNHLYLLSARDVAANPQIAEDWKAFFRFHVSADFWRSALPFIRAQLLAIHPALEQIAGRPLEDFRVTVRDHDVRRGNLARLPVRYQFAGDARVERSFAAPRSAFEALQRTAVLPRAGRRHARR
jgi:hypothetical protein